MAGSKQIPEFESLEEASEFWEEHSSEDFPQAWTPVTFSVWLDEARNEAEHGGGTDEAVTRDGE